MTNIYQSNIWKTINTEIYKKPFFEIEIFGKNYFGIIKEKKKIVNFKWFQITGIELGKVSDQEIINQISTIKNNFKGFGNILFQLGVIDPIDSFDIKNLKENGFEQKIKQKRIDIENRLIKLGLTKSFRENMPLANLILNINNGTDNLFNLISKSGRNHIRKAEKNNIYFELAKDEDWQSFYNIWSQTGNTKGFNIIPKSTFLQLKDYLLGNKVGNLFLAKKDNQIVSGSICLFIDDTIVYLYGGTDRNFGNVGGHHFLKYSMLQWGESNGYKNMDLMGVAPTGYPNHHLAGVSTFKQSLGGEKVDYFGNYDIILNPFLYKLFESIKKH